MQNNETPKIVYVKDEIYPERKEYYGDKIPWIMPGRYDVEREFDENRYVIRLKMNVITLIKKSLTTIVA